MSRQCACEIDPRIGQLAGHRRFLTKALSGQRPTGDRKMDFEGLDRTFEICIVVGHGDQIELNIGAVLPFMRMVRLRGELAGGTPEWSWLGFESEEEFLSVRHKVDLIVTLPSAGAGAGAVADDRNQFVASLLEHTGAMDVAILFGVSRNVGDLISMQSVPAVEWLEARVLGWRRLPGGLAISWGEGTGNDEVAREMAELMSGAGMGRITLGVECEVGRGMTFAREGSEPVVLVARPGVELWQSWSLCLSLTTAVLEWSEMLEIPMGSFRGCGNLSLLSLPGGCRRIGSGAFWACSALVEAKLDNVIAVDPHAFYGCCALRGFGSVTNLRWIGESAFEGVAFDEVPLGHLEELGASAFRGSALMRFSGKASALRGYCDTFSGGAHGLFGGCRHLDRLELTEAFARSMCVGRFGKRSISGELAGHVPGEIRYHGGLEQARESFGEVLRCSGKAVVVTTDEGQIRGGPGSAAAARDEGVRVSTKSLDPFCGQDLGVKMIDLSALRKGWVGGLGGSLWIEEVRLPRWLERLPQSLFQGCRSLRNVDVERCVLLREVGRSCFDQCESLRCVDFSDGLRTLGPLAFSESGLERLRLDHLSRLESVDARGMAWLVSVRLPRTFHGAVALENSWRVAEMTCGSCEIEWTGRFRCFRWAAMHGVCCEEQDCPLSHAWVTAEIAAAADRLGIPAVPC